MENLTNLGEAKAKIENLLQLHHNRPDGYLSTPAHLRFDVTTDSMMNFTTFDLAKKSIIKGDHIVGEEILPERWDDLVLNKDYIIIDRKIGVLIAEIASYEKHIKVVTVHQLNPEYPDLEIHLDNVDYLFRVVQVSRDIH